MQDSALGVFPLDPSGYVRQWLVTGPRSIPYTRSIANENTFRQEAADSTQVEPPKSAALGLAGPTGEPWRFHSSGRNDFLEFSGFWIGPTVVDSYAYAEIETEQEGDATARIWAAGTADLWVNGEHLTRLHVPRYMYPDFQTTTLPLRKGNNHLCVRLQAAAIRDTRVLFGLQFLGSPKLEVLVPGAAAWVDPVRWLDTVKADGIDALISEMPSPAGAEVALSDERFLVWPEGEKRLSFGADRPFQFTVRITCGGQTLTRHFEIPANRNGLPAGLPGDVRHAHLEYVASAPDDGFVPGANYSHIPLLARRFLGRTSPLDAPSFATLIDYINRRNDCADFALAALLRLTRLGLATEKETAEIKRTALAFRYWDDEPGSDAMCFRSENHSLLFYGCQFMAGQLWPDDVYSNTGRTGKEQIALGLERTQAWLDRTEAEGFLEFLSGTYMPLTVGALLNVVDFSGNAELSRRASALVDQVYEDLAGHAFQGITVGPQGRVYRNVLYPEEGGTQVMLSWATPEALPDFSRRDLKKIRDRTGDWITFLSTSKIYQPPQRLAERMRRPVSRRYKQAHAEIVLHKTPNYILTSLAVPRSNGEGGLHPGAAGYQQHLWQATLGFGCHIFVNHPGTSFDVDKLARPGYWYGNGVLPMVRQREEVLQSIFNIPDGTLPAPGPFELHPIPFTHAHWPADAFDRHQTCGQWVFGRKNSGCVGLWCSEPLTPWDDMLTGRELRAPGYRSAWAVVCGGLSEDGTFEAFIESCLARTPEFDRDKLVLRMKGEEPLAWPSADAVA